MVAKKRAATPSSPYLTTTDVEDLSPANRAAHEIVTIRGDLSPSVGRIMEAGLTEDETVQALTLFRDALSTPGDPHRDPRAAIAAATVGQGAGSAT